MESNVALLELRGIAWLKFKGDWLLAPVDHRHGLGDVTSHGHDTKIKEGLVRIFEL